MGQLYRWSKIITIEKSPCEPECIDTLSTPAIFILEHSFNIHTGDPGTMQACKSNWFVCLLVCASQSSTLWMAVENLAWELTFYSKWWKYKVNRNSGLDMYNVNVKFSTFGTLPQNSMCNFRKGGFDSFVPILCAYLVCHVQWLKSMMAKICDGWSDQWSKLQW